MAREWWSLVRSFAVAGGSNGQGVAIKLYKRDINNKWPVMRSVFLKCLLILWGIVQCQVASAEVYHPDFDCSRMDRTSPGQVLLCSDSDSARSELVLDQAYYALRHQSAAYLLPQLKANLVRDLAPLQACFSPTGVQGESPAECYQRVVAQITDRYRAQLTERAHEEAIRPIDDHIALQKKLQELGFLPPGVVPDGVYGKTTRQAILRWQEQVSQPNRDGFLGDDDARVLMPELAAKTSPQEAPSASTETVTPTATPSEPSTPAAASTEIRTPTAPTEAGTGNDGPAPSILRQGGTPGNAERQPPPSPPPPSNDTSSAAPSGEFASPAEVSPPRQEAAPSSSSSTDDSTAQQNTDHETTGRHSSLLALLFQPIGAIIHMCGAVLSAFWHVLVFVLRLPIRLVNLIWSFITALFSWKGLLLFIGYLIIKGLSSGEKKSKAGASEFSSAEEEEAYQQVGLLWSSFYEETGVRPIKTLIELLLEKRRDEAFVFLKTLLEEEVGKLPASLQETFSQARQEKSWKGFQRFSIGVMAFLKEHFQDGNEEAAQEQREREKAYRRAKQSGSAPPEDEPWHIVLEVSATASAEEITASYRRLMKQHHPDRFAQAGEAAYEAAVAKSKKITEAYRYARTLKQFSEKAGQKSQGSRQKSDAGTSSSGFTSSKEQEAHQKIGILWVNWVVELRIANGHVLLEHLVKQRLQEAFRFLVDLVRPISGETARAVLEELDKGRSWQDFQRCSVHVHGLLQQVARAAEARKRRQQEQERAREQAEAQKRQEQARRDRQRARNTAPRGRAWHVVLEVSETASNEDVTKAYRRLIKQHHPDRFAHVGGEAYEEAVRRTAEITQAYRYVKQYRQF